jgi:uncharacterized protein (DUF983 family)
MAAKVSRLKVIENGIRGGCPNCGAHTLFAVGKLFSVNKTCPRCGLEIEKGDGAFLGPFVINYSVTAFGLVVPVFLLFVTGHLGPVATLVSSLAAALLVPIALYRFSWAWWLMLYYFFLPDNLPSNLEGRQEDDE